MNEKDTKLEEDKNKIAEQYKQEYMELKTDRDATIEQLKGFYMRLLFGKLSEFGVVRFSYEM